MHYAYPYYPAGSFASPYYGGGALPHYQPTTRYYYP